MKEMGYLLFLPVEKSLEISGAAEGLKRFALFMLFI